MSTKEKFLKEMAAGYTFEGENIILGGAMIDGEVQTGTYVNLPLSTLNRHGLIAGATGTGKTKTLQVLAENLSMMSVPVLLMDIKGDLSGLGAASDGHRKIDERHESIGIPWESSDYPIEFLSISEEKGVRMRATVSEFGPVLMGKILNLNETQSGVLAVVFKYCDDQQWPLLDLKDLKKMLQYITNEGKEEIKKEYGHISPASTGAILRRIIELEGQGAELFFGEKSFEVDDLMRIDGAGYGVINIMRLTDIQDRPKLFSTFMLCLLAEIYSTFPEEGDLDAPKLVIFIDEAHLIFDEASDALMDQLETMVKLIRSKGVGLFFCTQNPTDVPDDVLSQLGLKVQHALRAFTARDRRQIKQSAENFPISEYYDVDQLLTELGIGEALVTVLNEDGIPTPLAWTMLRAPCSRMDVLSDSEIRERIRKSRLIGKYEEDIDRESAYEILQDKIEESQEAERQAELKRQQEELDRKAEERQSRRRRSSGGREKSRLEEIANSTTGRMVIREVTRGILGVLGLGGKRRSTRRKKSRRKKSSPWW
ncbi:MAG: helicase HerA-like domain-containing protein [Bacteroidota bacterium]